MNKILENKRTRVLLIAGGCVILAAVIGLCLMFAFRKTPASDDTLTLKSSSAQTISAPDIDVSSETSSVTSGLVLNVGETQSTQTSSTASQAPAKAPTTPTGQAGVAPTALRAKQTSISITVGGSAALTPVFTPSTAENKKVSYQCSDTGVATVSASGKVTGKKAGTAVVTITSQAKPGLKASVTVTVKNKSNSGGQTTAASKPNNNQGTEPAYKCGFPNHLCKDEADHNTTLDNEKRGCIYCGSHTCKSLYTFKNTDCPKYSTQKDPTIYCQVCGKKMGDGYNGTCAKYLTSGPCPDCGKWKEANTCHSH